MAHTTKVERDKGARRVQAKIVAQEGAAARSLRPVERRVLRTRARKGRAERLVKCSLRRAKEKVTRKPLKELHIKGEFSENSEDWKKELGRHGGEVCVDPEETIEEQKQMIEWYKTKGDEHLTQQGSVAEISVDLVLQAKALLSDNQADGPEDSVVSEMIKQLPLEKCT